MKKRFTTITAVIIALLICGLGVLAWWLEHRILSLLDQQQASVMMREHQEMQLLKLPELEGDYRDIQNRQSRLNIVYTEDQVVEAIRNIETLAQSEGITLSIEEINKPVIKKKRANNDDEKSSNKKEEPEEKRLLEKQPFSKSLYLQITTEGSYRSTVQFLHKLETAPFALDVTGLDFTAKEPDSKTILPPSNSNPFLLTEPQTPEVVEVPSNRIIGQITLYLYTR